MLVIWNPSIGKSFGIAGHNFLSEVYGFRVFPITKDRTVVNIIQTYNKPWHAEVFTLSSRVWNVIPSSNLPHESIRLDDPKTQVVIDRNSKVLDLPHSLKNKLYGYVCVSKLRESLVVYGSINVDEAECCGVREWGCMIVFRKLFTHGATEGGYELDYWYGFCDAADMVLYWFKSFFDSSQPTGCMLLTFQQYLVGTIVLNGKSGAVRFVECEGTCVLNVRFVVCYILDIWFVCCEYGNVVTYRQILLSRVKRLMEFKPIVNASVFRIWLKFSDLNDIVAVLLITCFGELIEEAMEGGISSKASTPSTYTMPCQFRILVNLSLTAFSLSKVTVPATRSHIVQQQEFTPFVLSPLLKHHRSVVVGACHGLVCMLGFHNGYKEWMLVIWNPSIGKSFGIVCPVTKDPTVVKFIQTHNKPWHAEVFTLSSGVWNVIPSSNLPPESVESVRLNPNTQVVIDRFIYWGARNSNSLTNELDGSVSVSKLRESLVVYGSINVDGTDGCGVWVMEHDSSFRKLFRIGPPYYILGFRKSGEPIFEVVKELGVSTHDGYRVSTVDVYDPCSQHIKSLGIDGLIGLFFMDSYKESLLLLNHSDSHIYYYNK
ncbi:hypothetical protein Tco_1316435 [Tanacetum coccineum]